MWESGVMELAKAAFLCLFGYLLPAVSLSDGRRPHTTCSYVKRVTCMWPKVTQLHLAKAFWMICTLSATYLIKYNTPDVPSQLHFLIYCLIITYCPQQHFPHFDLSTLSRAIYTTISTSKRHRWGFHRDLLQSMSHSTHTHVTPPCYSWSSSPVSLGSEAPGITEERELSTETTGSPIHFNPHVALSIEKQRQKLPVFKVHTLSPVTNTFARGFWNKPEHGITFCTDFFLPSFPLIW